MAPSSYNWEVEFPDKLAKSLVKFNQQLAQDVNIHYMSSEREGAEWVTRKPCVAGVVWSGAGGSSLVRGAGAATAETRTPGDSTHV